MSEKEKVEDVKVEEEKKVENTSVEPLKYGVGPFLVVTLVRENRVFRFEMPVGAQLDECVEASTECLNIVTAMRDEGKKKMAEAKKKEEEKSNEANSSEVKK